MDFLRVASGLACCTRRASSHRQKELEQNDQLIWKYNSALGDEQCCFGNDLHLRILVKLVCHYEGAHISGCVGSCLLPRSFSKDLGPSNNHHRCHFASAVSSSVAKYKSFCHIWVIPPWWLHLYQTPQGEISDAFSHVVGVKKVFVENFPPNKRSVCLLLGDVAQPRNRFAEPGPQNGLILWRTVS